LVGLILTIAPVCVTILKEEYSGIFNTQNKIGIVCINGPIYESTSCIKLLNTFFKDPMIKGIVVHIECKEGNPGSAQMIYQEIEYLKKEYPKPIITLVENICTAEGYLIAAATDTIIAINAIICNTVMFSNF
jgi:ClpP class serine protease